MVALILFLCSSYILHNKASIKALCFPCTRGVNHVFHTKSRKHPHLLHLMDRSEFKQKFLTQKSNEKQSRRPHPALRGIETSFTGHTGEFRVSLCAASLFIPTQILTLYPKRGANTPEISEHHRKHSSCWPERVKPRCT